MNDKITIKGNLKDNILNIKFRIHQPILTEKQAFRNHVIQDYVTYIIIKVGVRTLYELKLSEAITKSSILTFKVKQKEIKLGDIMNVKWITLLGNSEQYTIEIKKLITNMSKA